MIYTQDERQRSHHDFFFLRINEGRKEEKENVGHPKEEMSST